MMIYKKLSMVLAASLLFFACNDKPDLPEEPPVDKPVVVDPAQNIGMQIVDPQNLWLNPSEEIQITVSYENAPKEEKLSYKVENEEIAKISEEGMLTALKTGTTHVYVKNTKGKEQAFALLTVATVIPAEVQHTETDITLWPKEQLPEDGIIILPAGIENINRSAFSGLTELKEVVFPTSLQKIDSRAFSKSGILRLNVPEGVVIGALAFQDCEKLEEVYLGDGVSFKSWSQNFFTSCKALRSIRLPESITRLPENTFYGCESLETLSLPAKIERIERNVFTGCLSLKEIKLAEENEHFVVKGNALFNKALTEVLFYCPAAEGETYELPAEVEKISNSAFAKTKHLSKLVLNEAVKKIANDAFYNLESSSKLSTIVCRLNPDDIKILGRNRVVQYDGTLQVPAEYVTAYKESIAWSKAKVEAIK